MRARENSALFSCKMKSGLLSLGVAIMTSHALGQRTVSVPIPGLSTQIQADLYGEGNRAVILAHGGRFDRKSWAKQAQVLTEAGFAVLAISFRGDTVNSDGSPSALGSDADNATDVLAAAAYLRKAGAKTISAVGGSLGGSAIGDADARSKPGAFECVVFLASSGGDAPSRLTGRKLFIVARDDQGPAGPRLAEISKHYAAAPEPKKLVVVEGSAHAQFLFETEQATRVMNEIVSFLSAP